MTWMAFMLISIEKIVILEFDTHFPLFLQWQKIHILSEENRDDHLVHGLLFLNKDLSIRPQVLSVSPELPLLR